MSGRLAGDVGGCDEEGRFLMLDMNMFGTAAGHDDYAKMIYATF